MKLPICYGAVDVSSICQKHSFKVNYFLLTLWPGSVAMYIVLILFTDITEQFYCISCIADSTGGVVVDIYEKTTALK